jgi:predicted nucleic acid-binding protein
VVLLDTNVISELRRPDHCERSVLKWADRLSPLESYLSVITVLEIEIGAMRLERRDPGSGAILRAWIDDQVLPGFEGRILPIDTPIARRCARLHAPNPRSERDALIAATALVHGLTVATRNVGDFAPLGVEVVDPWSVPG